LDPSVKEDSEDASSVCGRECWNGFMASAMRRLQPMCDVYDTPCLQGMILF
jgi:hypothetical protein